MWLNAITEQEVFNDTDNTPYFRNPAIVNCRHESANAQEKHEFFGVSFHKDQ